MHSSSRRSFLKRTAAVAATTPLAASLFSLGARHAHAATTLIASPYGPLAPVNDLSTGLPLLQLPAGFLYKSFSWTGDLMLDGRPVPGSHDGMAVVRSWRVGRSTEMTLIRNHERGTGNAGSVIQPMGGGGIYDAGGSSATNRWVGGTTNLVFRDGDWVGTSPSLGGTATNCAGGPTPWGTWLTCEEVGSDATSPTTGKRHGYMFEVQADGALTTGEPLTGMGRYAHEANATDPVSGYVYMTEDQSGRSGLYRYVPSSTGGGIGSLVLGGELQMAKVVGGNCVNLAPAPLGETHQLEWVSIANPDQNRGSATFPGAPTLTGSSGPFVQGYAQGGCRMNRGEGAWYFNRRIYCVDTSGGAVSRGTVWELELDTMQFTCVYSSPAASAGDMPDNITISPRGGIVLCEDGGQAVQRLSVVTSDGNTFFLGSNNINLTAAQIAGAGKNIAAGNYRGNEFAGACFDPTGRYLFVNVQTPGITFAITGPWGRGPL